MLKEPICHLLEIPLEIRVEIYQHLFRSAQLSIQPNWPSIPHCRFSICSCWFPWHVVNTCRLLREEALEYLLAATTLQIAGLPSKAKLLPHAFSSAIPRAIVMNVESYSKSPLDLETFQSLRTLELHNIAVWCHYHDEEYLCGEGGDIVMYDLAMFNLKRNSLHLHQLCNTPYRAFNILLHCRYVVSSVKNETLVSGDCRLLCTVLTRLGCCDRCGQTDCLEQEKGSPDDTKKPLGRLLLKGKDVCGLLRRWMVFSSCRLRCSIELRECQLRQDWVTTRRCPPSPLRVAAL